MHEFKLEEISAVDFPAQKGARMTIMKRDSGEAPGGDNGLVSKAFTEGGNPMPDEKTVEDLQKQVDDLTKTLEATSNDNTAKLADAEAKLAAAEARASMTDVEKAHFDSLEGDAKVAFGKLSATERKAVIVKAAEKDETLEIDGRTISKSKVGEDNFAVFKALQSETEKNRKEAADERARREMVELAKRAEDELKELPGETVAKAKVLKAMSGMADEDRAVLETMLKAGSKAIKMAFDKLGHAARTEVNGDPMAFEKRVSEIASRDKIGKAEAMAVARKEYPEEFKAYQGQN
jgi:hypothetical protein